MGGSADRLIRKSNLIYRAGFDGAKAPGMSKSLSFALLAALLAVPATSAQLEGTSTLTLSNLPVGTFATNESLAYVPFTVDFQVSNMLCLGTGADVTVELVAETATADGANFTTSVEPAILHFTVPAGQATTFSTGQGAALSVRPDDAVATTTNVTTTITATITQITGCAAVTGGGESDSADVALSFERVRGSAPDSGQELPGPALPLVLLALVALAVALRRKA